MFDCILKVLCIIGVILLVCCLFCRSSNFLDVKSIVCEHLGIIKQNHVQMIGIYIIPIVFAITICRKECVNKDILDNLNIILSILISMFFAVLSILCSINSKNNNEKYQLLLKETFTSTVFEIIICLWLLFLSFTILFIGNYQENIMQRFLSFLIYYSTMIVILNILMIIKRIKAIFDNR